MKNLKQLPSPTLEEVQTQFNAWEQLRRQQEADVERQIDEEFIGRMSESGLS